MSEKQPNPGSPEAVALGCKCPVIDNGHGKGIAPAGGSVEDSGVFWVYSICPVHGAGDKKEEECK